MKRFKHAHSLAAVGAGVSLLLAACGNDDGGEETTTVRGSGRATSGSDKGPQATPRTPTATTAASGSPTASTSLPAGLAIPEAGPFTYKPGRDPFQSYFDITGETGTPNVPLLPLQKHELAKFKLTAVITGTVQPAAVILDPMNKPHFIKRGTLLGPPRGRVAQILSDRIVVEREFKDRLERVHKLKSELRLRNDEEELKQ